MHKYALLISYSLLITTISAEQTTPTTDIFREAHSGNRDAIRKRLENNEDCSKTEDATGKTALHIAAENGDAEMIDILTTEPDRSGITNWFYYWWYNYPKLPYKDQQDKNGDTAVHLSIQEGKTDATEKLFKKGARTDILNKQNYLPTFMILKKDNSALIPLLARYHCLNKKVNGKTVLHKAIIYNKPAITSALLQEGSLINEKDNKGKTLASIAAKNGDLVTLRVLIDHNININIPDSDGARPIHHGAYYGNYDIVKFFLENNASDVTDNKGNTPIHYAAKSGNTEIVNLLFAYKVNIKQRNNDGEDAFLIATHKRHWAFACDLVKKHGFNVNSCDQKGKTALIRATENGDLNALEILLDLGSNTQLTDHDKENALHKAVRLKDKNLAQRILAKNKALLETKNHRGETPLFVAVNEGYFEVVELLTQSGATVNTTNNDGSIPLLIAIERGNNYEKTINTLLQSGASLMVTDKKGNTAIHIASSQSHELLSTILQQRNKPHIDTLNHAGLTPLQCAAQANNIPAMKILAQYGAAFNTITPQGNTIAHSAMEKDSADALEYIIARNPHLLSSVNKNNEVPFIFGCRMGSSRCIEKLLHEREGEFINGNVEQGIHIAHQHGQYTVRDLLQKKIKERKKSFKKIHDAYSTVIYLIHENMDKRHILGRISYTPSQPQHYTEEQLYYMTESQRIKVYNHYLECEKRELQIHTQFSEELQAIMLQEIAAQAAHIAAQQERERIAHLKQERHDRERRERECAAAERALQEKNAKIARKEREIKERQERELDPVAQQKELDYFKQKKEKEDVAAIAAQRAEEKRIEREQKEADARRVAQQKQVAAAAAQQKLWDDAQKHNQALQAQQPYSAMNLQPSAPPMEEKEEMSTVHYVQGECCFCKEEDMQVTTSPCSTCANRKDYICTECLKECLKINKTKNLGNKCPLCTQQTLNEKLAEYIIAQQS